MIIAYFIELFKLVETHALTSFVVGVNSIWLKCLKVALLTI